MIARVLPPRRTDGFPRAERRAFDGIRPTTPRRSQRRRRGVGLGGLIGSGRTELLRLVYGLGPPDQREFLVDGKPLNRRRQQVRQSCQARYAGGGGGPFANADCPSPADYSGPVAVGSRGPGYRLISA